MTIDIAKLKAAAEKARAAVIDYEEGLIDAGELQRRAVSFKLLTDSPGDILDLIAQNEALVAAHVNLQLLAEVYRQAYEEALEVKNAQIAELEERLLRYAGIATRRAENVAELEKRIAELEARTVTVELPRGYAGPYGSMVYDADAVEAALEMAGINLETGGE